MISERYEPNTIEKKWYGYWMENNYFHSTPNEKKPYTIVIPPPNVTGVLHMGHMLNVTLQDVLIRRARLKGYNACWVPGTDHASIATEAKVVAQLKTKGVEKSAISRAEFLEYAWEWKKEYGGIILEQLKKLGASCDWNRTAFTLDEKLNKAVLKTFIDLHEKGLIYRGYRMVHWDPEAQTTLSDEEVIYTEQRGNLYYINYAIENSSEFITIATTRPETLFGDTAICIHPKDERLKHLKNKNAIVPICQRRIPIIADSYVDTEFGTGCLKITPAHDPNDKIIGERHALDLIDIFNKDGTLNQYGLHYEGRDRFWVRKTITKELQQMGRLTKIKSHLHKVGTSERTQAVIEPKISVQWFLKMETLVKPAIKAVLEDEEIKFYPKYYKNTYRNWLVNIKDWNISRQLWWGHRIPAYFYGKGLQDYVVAEDVASALKKVQEKTGKIVKAKDLKQDKDCLDTWFSSWLWPISVFDGIAKPDNPEFKYYYPTDDLVTAPDILFFWVARMIFAGFEFTQKRPFKNVYFTGLVRDKKRRKMSKSLGNSPDPLALIESYGADGVRVGLLLSTCAGNDLLFDEELCQQGRNFASKIWNAFRLIKSFKVAEKTQPESCKIAVDWYANKFQKQLDRIENSFEQFRINEALMVLYKLIWEDFCAWFLEVIKPAYGKTIDKTTYEKTILFLEHNLKILHPFMPFLTEEIWQNIRQRTPEQALIIADYPEKKPFENSLIEHFETTQEIISNIRKIRKEKKISFKNAVDLYTSAAEKTIHHPSVLKKLCHIQNIKPSEKKLENAAAFIVKGNEYFIPVAAAVDTATKKQELLKELAYAEGFLNAVEKKLTNQRFIKNAPQKVIENERKKQQDALSKIKILKNTLKGL